MIRFRKRQTPESYFRDPNLGRSRDASLGEGIVVQKRKISYRDHP